MRVNRKVFHNFIANCFQDCRRSGFWLALTFGSLLLCVASTPCGICGEREFAVNDERVLPPVNDRFKAGGKNELPDFQKHVVPLLSRLGCNGRACHGSLQGRGGFQLSLFGYDFESDLKALTDPDAMRVDTEFPEDSLVLQKPTDAASHEGGKRFDDQGWEYELLNQWISHGATKSEGLHQLTTLRVEPSEIIFDFDSDQKVQLRVVAEWADGTREEVTPLTRFESKDQAIAEVSVDGVVSTTGHGLTHLVIGYDKSVVTVPVIRPYSATTLDSISQEWKAKEVDSHVAELLRKLAIRPSELADDATFLRRVSLDLTGTLPTPQEVQDFLADTSPNKREKKIDELMERPAYAAWWATFLCDLTGNGSSQLANALPTRNEANRVWFEWTYERVANNVPYDQIVEGIVIGQNRHPDESYYDYSERMCEVYRREGEVEPKDLEAMPYFWARQDLREVENRAISFAYAFMGVRIQCAQCHKHPFDQWSKNDFQQFADFFSRVTYDRNGRNPADRDDSTRLMKELQLNARGGQQRQELAKRFEAGKTIPFPQLVMARQGRARDGDKLATLLGGHVVDLSRVEDPRTEVMRWLLEEDNPYFARAFVNRVWARYFGVGIVEPADDLSLGNPPNNENLLSHLESGFRASGYDMKWLHREILNSRTYQLTWKPNESNVQDERHFSHALARRLPAEVIVDAITQGSASKERNQKFAWDLSSRAIAIPGTPQSRSTRGAGYALSIFGKSDRVANCDCERSEDVSLIQTLYLRNDSELNQLIERRNGGWLAELNAISSRNAPTPDLEKQVQRGKRRLRDLKTKLQRAEENQAPGNRQQQLRQQIRRMETQLAQASRKLEQRPQSSAEALDIPTLLTEAYLRTLSRFPTADEQERMRRYLTESENPGDGMRDVLWALMNTKEFMVNH